MDGKEPTVRKQLRCTKCGYAGTLWTLYSTDLETYRWRSDDVEDAYTIIFSSSKSVNTESSSLPDTAVCPQCNHEFNVTPIEWAYEFD